MPEINSLLKLDLKTLVFFSLKYFIHVYDVVLI